MGLTAKSTGKKVLKQDINVLQEKCDYTVAIARKSKCWQVNNI